MLLGRLEFLEFISQSLKTVCFHKETRKKEIKIKENNTFLGLQKRELFGIKQCLEHHEFSTWWCKFVFVWIFFWEIWFFLSTYYMLVLVLGAFICIPVIFVIVLKINGIKYLTDCWRLSRKSVSPLLLDDWNGALEP